MALTGHLSDLSLSELIEFFCNQRKSGRLKVLYPQGAGYFYLQAVRWLTRTSACCTASTLFTTRSRFRTRSLNSDAEAKNRTINQPWTQVYARRSAPPR